jgi:hypothetical protein
MFPRKPKLAQTPLIPKEKNSIFSCCGFLFNKKKAVALVIPKSNSPYVDNRFLNSIGQPILSQPTSHSMEKYLTLEPDGGTLGISPDTPLPPLLREESRSDLFHDTQNRHL